MGEEGVSTAEGLEPILTRAREIALDQGHDLIRPTHLLVAILADRATPWPILVLERGGLSDDSALRRLGWRPPAAWADTRAPRYRSSMRMMLLMASVVLLVSILRLARRLFAIRARPRSEGHLPISADSEEMLRLAGAIKGDRPGRTEAGHLLLSLASRPGEHLKVLPNATVLACALRIRLGLASPRHRLIVACDRPKLITRRCHMRIDREVARHGRFSRWGLASLLYRGAGVLFALAVFPITVLATALLYLFLWPASLLVAATRSLCAAAAGCESSSHLWLKVPGGEVALTPTSRPPSPRAAAAALLAPRLVAAMFCILALLALLWQARDVGVVLSPVLYRRPDLIDGAAQEGIWRGPLMILAGMLEANGTAAGIGLLAGLGAGVMSIPTFSEIELVRLHAGHDAGGGSRLARALTAPASLFTGAVSCVEAFLPFTGSPIYATAYLVPLFLSLLIAGALLQLTPF